MWDNGFVWVLNLIDWWEFSHHYIIIVCMILIYLLLRNPLFNIVFKPCVTTRLCHCIIYGYNYQVPYRVYRCEGEVCLFDPVFCTDHNALLGAFLHILFCILVNAFLRYFTKDVWVGKVLHTLTTDLTIHPLFS